MPAVQGPLEPPASSIASAGRSIGSAEGAGSEASSSSVAPPYRVRTARRARFTSDSRSRRSDASPGSPTPPAEMPAGKSTATRHRHRRTDSAGASPDWPAGSTTRASSTKAAPLPGSGRSRGSRPLWRSTQRGLSTVLAVQLPSRIAPGRKDPAPRCEAPADATLPADREFLPTGVRWSSSPAPARENVGRSVHRRAGSRSSRVYSDANG